MATEAPGAGQERSVGPSLYLLARVNPVLYFDPYGLNVWDEDIDNAIADLFADRAAAAKHAFDQIGQMAQATGQAVMFGAISAMFPPVALGLSAWTIAVSLEDMYYNGLTWENAATATLGGVGIGASLGPSLSQARAFTGRLRGALGRAKARYAGRIGSGAGRLIGHHMVPRAVLKSLPKNIASHPRVRGARGAPNIWKIPENVHKQIHQGARGGLWNKRWFEEIDRHGGRSGVTVEDIMEIRDLLTSEFNLWQYRP